MHAVFGLVSYFMTPVATATFPKKFHPILQTTYSVLPYICLSLQVLLILEWIIFPSVIVNRQRASRGTINDFTRVSEQFWNSNMARFFFSKDRAMFRTSGHAKMATA